MQVVVRTKVCQRGGGPRDLWSGKHALDHDGREGPGTPSRVGRIGGKAAHLFADQRDLDLARDSTIPPVEPADRLSMLRVVAEGCDEGLALCGD
jgi:hypothetical protein